MGLCFLDKSEFLTTMNLASVLCRPCLLGLSEMFEEGTGMGTLQSQLLRDALSSLL